MSQSCDITAIIIGRNEYVTLKKNLENLAAYLKESPLSVQVLYVDSASTDGSVEMAATFRDSIADFGVIRLEGEMNAAAGRNAGIRHARGKHVLFLDGDVVFDCSFIRHAIDLLQQQPGIGAVTGRLLEVYDRDKPEAVINRVSHGREKSCCLGGNFICRMETVRQIGFFDERFRLNEDIDFTVRITLRQLDLIESAEVFGVHFTEPYNEKSRLCRDLARLNYVYPGLLLRKYLFRRGMSNVLRSQSNVYLRFFLLLALSFALITPWLLVPPVAAGVLITVRVKKELQETLASRALSFLKGAQVALGLFCLKQRPRYQTVKVI